MSSEHCSYLDREFVGGRIQIIMTEVEVPDASVPIEGIDQVAGPLVANPAVAHVEQTQRKALEDKSSQLLARGLREGASRDVQTRQVVHFVELANAGVQVVVELHGAHQVDVCHLFRPHAD